MKLTDRTPRIYVACLNAQNKEVLGGRWIDCLNTWQRMRREIEALLTAYTDV